MVTRTFILLSLLLTLSTAAGAQSLKPEDPAPVQPGLNKGTTDNFVGAHYWYFTAEPGDVTVKVSFVAMSLLGNAQKTPLTITMYDAARTWKVSKVITSDRNSAEATFPGHLKKSTRVILCIAPPSGGLVRMGGDYQLQVTGSVKYGQANTGKDPIVSTMTGNDDFGPTRFKPDGTVETSTGMHGTWKVFDADNRIYNVDIEGTHLSVRYVPGRGLVDVRDPSSIVFQALR